jgi:hypothetical protein
MSTLRRPSLSPQSATGATNRPKRFYYSPLSNVHTLIWIPKWFRMRSIQWRYTFGNMKKKTHTHTHKGEQIRRVRDIPTVVSIFLLQPTRTIIKVLCEVWEGALIWFIIHLSGFFLVFSMNVLPSAFQNFKTDNLQTIVISVVLTFCFRIMVFVHLGDSWKTSPLGRLALCCWIVLEDASLLHRSC